MLGALHGRSCGCRPFVSSIVLYCKAQLVTQQKRESNPNCVIKSLKHRHQVNQLAGRIASPPQIDPGWQ